jgi:hypothetical protein
MLLNLPRHIADLSFIHHSLIFIQQPDLTSFDLQREILGIDATLGQAASDEPQARLRGAR